MSVAPLVSVLIRTRNRAALLLQAVQSVTRQSHRPLEIVVVNDGGDNSALALATHCSQHNVDFRWLENAGKGRSAAANTALEAAQGEYCLFLDDDDWLDPPHIATLLHALKAGSETLAAYSNVRTVNEDGQQDEKAFSSSFDATRLRVENYIPIHAVLFARSLYERGCRFDTTLDRFEDWDFWLQVLQHTSFQHVNVCTANYRIAAQSGFGAKAEEDIKQLRAKFYQKWWPATELQDLLAVADRARQYPRIAPLEAEKSDLQKYLNALIKSENALSEELIERRAQLAQAHLDMMELQETYHRLNHDYGIEKEVTAALRRDIDTIYRSRSWKLTRPLRMVTKLRYFLRTEGWQGVLKRVHFKLYKHAPQLPRILPTAPKQHPGPLQFTEHAQPVVSIVIPLYNNSGFTKHCLASILANSGALPYEVIVVDDCSSDDTQAMLQQVHGIVKLRNATNMGFIRTCNAGAAAARGEFVLFLNNDTEPLKGWLDALVQTFNDRPDAGMVGSKLLFGNGTLQEAGGIVWRDGSAWNLGRGEDPNNPAFNYLRAVDYCSGACLMLRRADFFALGQFDLHYLPAYYEDTDLAFQVRKSGKQVYYQPHSLVVHFEGISNGTDTGSGIKAYQVTNHKKFFARWEDTLRSHRPNGILPHLEKERAVRKRALIVDARVLMPDNDSGSLRMFNLIKILQSLQYKVTFIPDNMEYHERYTPMLQSLGIECWFNPYQESVPEHLQQHGGLYNLIILSRADVAENNIDAARKYAPQAQILFDTVDLHFVRERRQAELSGSKMEKEAAELRRVQELGIARRSHQTIVVSPVEVEIFRQEAPEVRVALVSNIHATHGRSKGWKEREHILFIGNFEHPPNVDAMHHFIDDIYPLLQQQRPGIKLLILGPHAPKSLTSKGNALVEFVGFVDDITPYFNNARLSIAPLRYGAGVKGKVNSSMSYGVPVVASPMAAEGMGLTDGVDVLIADSPETFAHAIIRAYDDEALWNTLSDGGLANLQRNFSFEVAREQIEAILKSR